MTARPFVVLAALPEEAAAVLGLVRTTLKTSAPPMFRACHELYVEDHNTGKRYPGILAQLDGTGRMHAAVSTTHAIHAWNPQFLLMVGTAGGFRSKGVALGDIVVATEVLDYESQRLGVGAPLIRWASYQPDALLLDLARKIAELPFRGIESAPNALPPVHFGPIFSGDKVVASQKALQKLLAFRNEALGVEMEGAGVAFAAGRAPAPVPFLMVRGVADHADEQKHTDCRNWGTIACESAARFVLALLTSWTHQQQKQDEVKDE